MRRNVRIGYTGSNLRFAVKLLSDIGSPDTGRPGDDKVSECDCKGDPEKNLMIIFVGIVGRCIDLNAGESECWGRGVEDMKLGRDGGQGIGRREWDGEAERDATRTVGTTGVKGEGRIGRLVGEGGNISGGYISWSSD